MNLLSGVAAMLGAVLTASVVAGRHVEVVAISGDVKIEAKFRGNVVVEAKKNVKIEAHKEDVSIVSKKRNVGIEADKDFFLHAVKGKAKIWVQKDILIESLDDKKIILKAGNSTIEMTNEKITIKADLIELVSNDEKGKVAVGKCGMGDAVNVESKTHLRLYSQNGTVNVAEKGFMVLNAKNEMTVYTKEFNAKGAKKCIWPQHDDSA